MDSPTATPMVLAKGAHLASEGDVEALKLARTTKDAIKAADFLFMELPLSSCWLSRSHSMVPSGKVVLYRKRSYLDNSKETIEIPMNIR